VLYIASMGLLGLRRGLATLNLETNYTFFYSTVFTVPKYNGCVKENRFQRLSHLSPITKIVSNRCLEFDRDYIYAANGSPQYMIEILFQVLQIQ
jgi:hypothetical protein